MVMHPPAQLVMSNLPPFQQQQGGPVVDYTTQPLFGGAMSCNIPKRFLDVSHIRDVPDHQEVFVDSNTTDQSLIIELLSYDPSIPDDVAAQYHFTELANANEAPVGIHSHILATQLLSPQDVPHLYASPSQQQQQHIFKVILMGRQSVSKYNEHARNTVNLYMALLRIPSVTTDILITINEPTHIAEGSSSAKSSFNPEVAAQAAATSPAHEILRNFLLSLQIHDWGLFGN